MCLEPASCFDFAAAASYGVRVIRVGAVQAPKDLAYLLDGKSSSVEDDKAQLLNALPRLRRQLSFAGEHGLKVIITLVDLPGSLFFSFDHDKDNGIDSKNPLLFWQGHEHRSRVARFWGFLAEQLLDLSHLIMGYDLINEPYTPEDRECGFFNTPPTSHRSALNQFYQEAVQEIRRSDKNTAVIIKCTWFAMPTAMNMLEPIDDPNVKYGFHCYIPPPLTLGIRDLGTTRQYPGMILKHDLETSNEQVYIDKEYLHQFLLNHVDAWQRKHGIPSSSMVVTEFGICRGVIGARAYLEDLMDIFTQFGWSWLLFSFRDEQWDAMDYELGECKQNKLYRSPSDLFLCAANHFR